MQRGADDHLTSTEAAKLLAAIPKPEAPGARPAGTDDPTAKDPFLLGMGL